ncbi:MAG: single-stranded DNA-binding protein [Firmicutes bacterium]|nr:single-stranded DNA-binding protein [Bacillota bacterium]MCM1401851.1 single-stranded DNA-binding protein [Bacteroides sp.]MCM1477836.1 single-stranded DNA-binding protein [Bacteroides sp.]
MSVNKVILLGNVGRDPQVRYVGTRPVAEFTLATSERVRAREGEQTPATERTEWHRIVTWDANASIAERYIRKGSKIYVEGKLRTRTWEDRNTIKHTVTEIYADVIELLSRPAGESQ